MRLDVLVSQAFSLSRNISEKLLKSQKVFHNGKMCLSGGQKIKQGDIISVRGYGKFLVEDFRKNIKKRPSVYHTGDLSIGGIYDYTS